MAYKSLENILEDIHNTVDVLDLLKPVYNFKVDGGAAFASD